MSITTEGTFEGNIEAHLLTHGWSRVSPDTYDRKLGLFPDELLAFVQATQPRQWALLVRRHGGEDAARAKFLARVAAEIDHRGTIAVLRGTVKDTGVEVRLCYFKPASRLNDEQLARYRANRLAVVRQLHHSESRPRDSLDVTLVTNGIPVATAELKNTLTGQSVADAQTQYRTDRNPADLIFARRTLVHFAVDPHHVSMTTRLQGQATRFLPFDQGSAGAGSPGTSGNPPAPDGRYQTSYLWEQVWQRDAWLDILGNFVHSSGKTILFPRFHQWHAVRSILDATRRDGAGVDRLIQHSAGSGKSNTIAWSAHQLSRLHDDDDQPIFDKVVVITDRKVLDKQLQDTVAGFDHTPGTIVRVDKNSVQLKEALEGNAARIIITTLQKFPVVVAKAAEDAAKGESKEIAGRHFAIVVDEAHSSTSGESVKELKKVLGAPEESLAAAEEIENAAEDAADANDPVLASAAHRGKQKNLSFFAFTATPKERTLDLFGELGDDGLKHPFHTYSMRQAIAEGFILDVLRNYTTYAVYYRLANAEGGFDPTVDEHKGKVALARFASLHPYEMDQKAEIIVEHFRQKTSRKIKGHAKAMVVTRSRLHAVKTKEAIDRYIARKGYDKGPRPVRALVAFSGAVTDPDLPEKQWTEPELNGFAESELPEKFHGDDYQVLVVAEKYQTGFDEPLLHTMYVDKKLAGVKAVQTLSRLNRTAPGKDDTFVLDFANTAEEIQQAFQGFYEETLTTPTDPNALYNLSTDLWSARVLSEPEVDAAVAALLSGDPARQAQIYDNLGPAVGRWIALEDDEAEAFRGTLDQFCRAYGFLAQVMPFIDPSLEKLYLYGKVLLTQLPAGEDEPMPQISNQLQLTHLRLSITSQDDISLEPGQSEPGTALPGSGLGPQNEPVMDKLSALIKVMNDKFGADLNDADKLTFEQTRMDLMRRDDMRVIAENNDRAQYRLVLEDRADDIIVDRGSRNGQLFDYYFSRPEVRTAFIDYLMSTYDEFRAGATGA
ncbi:type I restriction endonuclease subunit R [Acidipropionibacterium timonense]|uniref:type I restriction endonuclease subunit R n=1 Tax=Acidipropionibacterium timonense TaxID=2161818 RepID=UPI001030E85E|nr:DEAD/DEAH box helicase family protein [Acidipropionibacterium timonense]